MDVPSVLILVLQIEDLYFIQIKFMNGLDCEISHRIAYFQVNIESAFLSSGWIQSWVKWVVYFSSFDMGDCLRYGGMRS